MKFCSLFLSLHLSLFVIISCVSEDDNFAYVTNIGSGGGGGNPNESSDTIFVSGLPISATEEDIQNFFGQIGLIKVKLS